MTVVQLTANLRIWYDRYTAEIAAASLKTAAEKEAEEVILYPQLLLNESEQGVVISSV